MKKVIYSLFMMILLGIAPAIEATFFNFFQGKQEYVEDIAQIKKYPVAHVYEPETIAEVQKLVAEIQGPIAVAGGHFSQGGQIAYPQGIVLDMRKLCAIKACDFEHKLIRVQAGVTWRQIQEYIDPHNLSVAVMQSYNDFTVGGSLSVNVHGRMLEYGSLIDTIESIDIVIADGTLVHASRAENPDIFAAAIGGYGLVGVIVQAIIRLTNNEKFERRIHIVPVSDYDHFFHTYIQTDPQVKLHNAVLFPKEKKKIMSVAWCSTDKDLTITDRMQKPVRFWQVVIGGHLLQRLPFLHHIRPYLQESNMKDDLVCWRNYEMSWSVQSIEPLMRMISTNVLQEYFVPCKNLQSFIEQLYEIIDQYKVNILNISVRYVKADTTSVLAYAPEDSCAVVLYINMFNAKVFVKGAKRWTRKLIDCALSLDGTFYLPYQLHATKAQFRTAYPRFGEFLRLKKRYDPTGKFRNYLFDAYLE